MLAEFAPKQQMCQWHHSSLTQSFTKEPEFERKPIQLPSHIQDSKLKQEKRRAKREDQQEQTQEDKKKD
jgi:hypothetical protein